MTTPLSPAQFDELHDFVQIQTGAGFAAATTIVDEAVELFGDTTEDTEVLRRVANLLVQRALANHLAEQAGWPETTDCDRLDAAFAQLDDAGVVARHNFSCCATCGNDEIAEEMRQVEKAGRVVRGFTFFHLQDTESAVRGEPLYLSYGAAGGGSEQSVEIGHEVIRTLREHGLDPRWNGKLAHRIMLQMEWRRRRDDRQSYQG